MKISSFTSKELTTSSKRLIAYEGPCESVRSISWTLVSKTDIVLGKGRFATCVKGYLQGTSVCIKINCDGASSSRAVDLISKEANILSKLGHPAVCFLQGIQTQQKPYYLLTNLYEVRGFSLTVYDLIFPNDISDINKKDIALSVHQEVDASVWFKITLHIAEGIDHFHQRNIVHRDLKTDNITLYERNKILMPVIIDFGKSDLIQNTKKYSLTKEQKKEYRVKHKHIAPDLVDGITKPSPLSDIYSYGRIFKSIVRNFPISSKLIPDVIVNMVNDCLSYHFTDRPNAQSIIVTLKTASYVTETTEE